MNIRSKYLKVFSNCIPVKGSIRGIIYDLQRGTYQFIPKDLYTILMDYDGHIIEEIYEAYGGINKEAIDGYLNFLLEHDFIFLTDSTEEARLYPPIDFKAHSPCLLDNIIVDYDTVNPGLNLRSIIQEVNAMNLRNFELRILGACDLDELSALLLLFDGSCVQNLVLFLPYMEVNNPELERFLAKYIRVSVLIFYSAPFDRISQLKSKRVELVYSSKFLPDSRMCGNIQQGYFRVGLESYMETLNHNNCLHQKLYINNSGQVKNCPAVKNTIGTINTLGLREILALEETKVFWDITKDQVKVCQDCEFRYMCSDCRAFTVDPDDMFSKPLKCGYDPYTAKWESWSEINSNQEAIDIYDMRALVPLTIEKEPIKASPMTNIG